ncbi:LolA family protein [Streptomyces syringium]|uniref:Outer membrane lipoprotein-sorting protein n=1 Tax=Streptomyces syringium TaxID=76729 RepID=A0ABS4Y4P1_9ACTN|nr:sigma-E factor regulatory protein RseB domain-containing protein [Streptomyces syringium]MBP2403620.1 outer membrane lipoprotein-sorting protein [Streptomyces syringium]
MARIQPTQGADEAGTPGTGRRKAARYVVPVAVAGVAAATIGFVVPALASTGDPDLPKISAQDLIAKMAKSDVQQASGTVKISTDLGLPSLPSGFSLGDAGKGSGGGKGGDAADPQAKLTELLSGSHTLRIAVDGPDKQRLSIVERAAEYSVIRNGDDVWAYDSASDSAHHSKAPKSKAPKQQGGDGHEVPKDLAGASPQELAKRALATVDDTTSVTVDGTAKVAGRDAYQLVIKPKGGDSTVGAVRIAVDAKNGVPLKFTLAPKSGKAIVDAGFTKVDFGKPAAKNFTFTPSKGTKVTEDSGKPGKGDDAAKLKGKLPGAGELPGLTGLPGLDGASDASGMKVIGKGWSSIAEIKGPKDAVGKLSEDAKGKGKSGDAAALLDSFGKKVSGDFGSGRVFSTRIVNVLMTDDGRVYAGAVTKDALVKAANSAK